MLNKIIKRKKMKIILNLYSDNDFGNCKVDTIIIMTNKMPVSFLKGIISQKYNIDKSIIVLSTKINNSHFVILVDNFPLYFFNIKEYSRIFVQIMEKPKIIEENYKKIKQRENKSQYLRKLNIFRKRANMDVIRESTLEDIESVKKENNQDKKEHIDNNINEEEEENENNSLSNNINNIKDKNNIDELPKIIEERFNNAIINNKINEFRDIMKHYRDKIDINKPIGQSQKYSPIHFASMFGYSEMLQDLITKYNADVNLISKDGWSPIHLCAFKGNMSILYILIKIKRVKINLSLPNLGTPLHCACKQNNIEVISLLLSKCNPELKSDEGLLSIELTKDKNIIKLINKVIKGQNYEDNESPKENGKGKEKEKLDTSTNKETNEQSEKFRFLKEVKNIPACPPRYVGFIYKRGKILGRYNPRYVEINPIKNLYLRYKFREDYPLKAKEASFLSNIKSCKLMETSDKETFFYIELILEDSKQVFRFESLKVCNLWVDKLNKCIEYSKFWKTLSLKYIDVHPYLNSLNPEIFEIDYFTGEIRKFEFTKEEKEKQKIKLDGIMNEKKINANNINNPKVNEDCNSKLEKNDVNIYQFKKIIYTCNLYRIYKVKHKLNGDYFIMKIFNKNNLEKNKLIKNFTTELNMQKQLIFPFCLSINHSVEIGNSLYLTSEYCSGNNLTFYKNRKLFEENSIKLYIAEIILTIEYLHKLEYSCKSLSLENILITGDNHIKLANLKLNKIEFTYEDGNKICSGVGEDIYSIGCILYELISGIPPLFITNLNFITKKKEEELFLFDYFSDNLKDLLSKLLGKEPKKRIGFKNKKELKNHSWFKNINWDNLLIKCSNPSINFSLIKKEIEESFHNS